jgi:hypothetical protein
MEQHEGYVALFDVLGFTNLIARESHVKELEEYIGCVKNATQTPEGSPKVQYVLFSDSIILTTTDPGEDSFKALIQACSHLFRSLLAGEFPVRGAIAFGSFFRSQEDASGVFVAGKPIVEAYHVEKSQDWIGIKLGDSVIRKFPDLAKRCEIGAWQGDECAESEARLPWSLFVQKWQIPFQPAPHPLDHVYMDGYAIVPTEGRDASPKNILETLSRCREHLDRIKSLAPDPKSQRKAHETDSWFNSLIGSWSRAHDWWKDHK